MAIDLLFSTLLSTIYCKTKHDFIVSFSLITRDENLRLKFVDCQQRLSAVMECVAFGCMYQLVYPHKT